MKPKHSKHVHLKNAPSVEAVLDIRVKHNNVKTEVFYIPDGEFRKLFPAQDKIRLVHGAIENIAGFSVHESLLGHLYKSPDDGEQTQFRINGFSYHRVGKYPGWNAFLKGALKCWKQYSKLAPVNEIERFGLRFVNQIEVKGLSTDLKKSFKINLNVPDACKIGKIERYEYKYTTRFEKEGVIANVALAPTVNTLVEKTCPKMVYDIDVFSTEISHNFNDKYIVKSFETLRNLKNDIFFSSLTPETLRQFK